MPQLIAISSGFLMFALITLLFGKLGGGNLQLQKRLDNISKLNAAGANDGESINLPFKDRFIKPAFGSLVMVIENILPVNEKSLKRVAAQLSQGGIKTKPRDYVAVNVLAMVGCGLVGGYIGVVEHLPMSQILIYFSMGMVAGYILRRFSLKKAITSRKENLELALPEILDLLCVSVEAGLGFDQAVQYVVSRCKGPLIDEFSVFQREISLGKTRVEALRGLSDRCGVDEVKSFVSVIIQADELGFSIKNVLKTQSAAMRLYHKQKVEEKAMKIPVKILLPLVGFIFPVLFIVLLGPAVPSIISALEGF